MSGDAAFDSQRLRNLRAKKSIVLLTLSNPRKNVTRSEYWPYRRWGD